MGTRGYFAFRYKNRYYVIYNNYDSYFSGLGYELIRSIRELTKEQWEDIKHALTTYPLKEEHNGDELRTGSDWRTENLVLRTMEDYQGSLVITREPELDVFIEYVYIIDLDIDVFTVISRHHKEEDYPDEERRYSCRFENLTKEWLDSCDSE